MQLKQSVYTTCIQLVDTKLQTLQKTLQELSEGAESDSKSSAGDKHETARAMMQLEQEKISRQIDDVLKQKVLLQKMDLHTNPAQITKGSLVKTNKGYLFLSVALGKIVIDDMDVIVLSPQSPLGLKLMGLARGTSIEINGTSYHIEEIS
jgi:transcription elongation GreA/GreB family factor